MSVMLCCFVLMIYAVSHISMCSLYSSFAFSTPEMDWTPPRDRKNTARLLGQTVFIDDFHNSHRIVRLAMLIFAMSDEFIHPCFSRAFPVKLSSIGIFVLSVNLSVNF